MFFYSQFLWDAASSEAVGKRKVSDGHVTALRWTQRRGYEAVMQGGDVLISGGQDGVVKAWDPRVGKVSLFYFISVWAILNNDVVFCCSQEAVASVDAHRQKGGSGAVGDITQMPSGKVVTGGADGHVAVLDPRRGYQVVARIPVGDFVYSLASVGAFILFDSVWANMMTCFVYHNSYRADGFGWDGCGSYARHRRGRLGDTEGDVRAGCEQGGGAGDRAGW